MAGLLDFVARFGAEARCIEYLAGLRWPGGFVCSGCAAGYAPGPAFLKGGDAAPWCCDTTPAG